MTSTLRTILGGIGFLLFSLDVLEQGFAHSSKAMSNLLKKFTKTKIHSILTGSLATAILQSSSVTSLITLALVGSGVLGLTQAIGVILGANIGTTLFDGIIGLVGISGGFGINLKLITLPCIALGGIGMVFIKKRKSFFLVLLSFGLMIYSLELLKAGVSDIKNQIDLTWIIGMNYGLVFLFGVAITLVMQSSSATTLLAMTALSEGVLHFEECLALIIGAYLGTCITIVIGAMGGTTIKKQVAASHVGFNIIFCTVLLLLFKPIVFLLQYLKTSIVDTNLSSLNQDVQLISMFHIFAKAIGVACFYPFIDRFKNIILYLFPNKQQKLGLRVESWTNTLSFTIKEELLTEDMKDIRKHTLHHIETSLKFPSQHQQQEHDDLIASGSLLIQAVNNLESLENRKVHNATDAIQHIMYALNDNNAIINHLDHLSLTDNDILKSYYLNIQEQFHKLIQTHLGYEQQKSLLQEIKLQDNFLIENNNFSAEQITLLSNINHGFYQCCRNLIIAKDLM